MNGDINIGIDTFFEEDYKINVDGTEVTLEGTGYEATIPAGGKVEITYSYTTTEAGTLVNDVTAAVKGTNISVGGDVEVEVNAPKHTVTFHENGGSDVDNQRVVDGETADEPEAPTRENYTFAGWYENGELVSEDATYTFTADVDRTLTAKFIKKTYTVSVTPEEGGTVIGAGSYEHGESVTVTATANKGYVFVGWYENGELVSAEATITFTAEANRELTAQFAPQVVYGDANGDGTLNDDDVALIREYIARFNYDANTSSVNVEAEADFNGDGQINMKDIILLRQYIANNG